MLEKEFTDMVINHRKALKVHAFNFTRNHEDANDLVQDTLVKAITYHNKYKRGTNLNGWLYTIMKNIFINNYRKKLKKNIYVFQTDEIPCAKLNYSSTKNKGEGKFVLDDIKNALSTLAEEYYIPFTMYFEGYKYHEISIHMGLPIGTVKTRIHMARKLLKSVLVDYSKNAVVPEFTDPNSKDLVPILQLHGTAFEKEAYQVQKRTG